MVVHKRDDVYCPKCGGLMVVRRNRQTREPFYGCTEYPDCKGTRSIDAFGEPEYYDWELEDDDGARE